MGILNIRPAVRMGSKAIIAIAGNTGDGKTYTALQIARGMVNDTRKIGFLDTENGRGSFYSDILDGQFLIADLYAPFSPLRYREAIIEFQNAGVEVLVIDSVSHEWEGDGGCDDIANAPKADGTARKIANWIGAKREHKKFMQSLLNCNMHVICCIRAREKTSFKNADKPVSLGVQPICEKNFMYEMMASFMVTERGKNQSFTKIPEFLLSAFGDGANFLGPQVGKKIIEWINGGGKEDPEIKRLKSEMLIASEESVDAIKAIWSKLTKEQQAQMKDHTNVCKKAAEDYERLAKQAAEQSEQPENINTELETYRALYKDCKTLAELQVIGYNNDSQEVANLYDQFYKLLGGQD